MAVLVHIEAPKGSATALSAITDGEILTPNGAGTKVQHATAHNQICVGVAAEAAAADEGVRIYLPGQLAKVRCGATLDAANGADDYKLTANADGKAVKAGQNEVVTLMWCPRPGETAADGDFITCRILENSGLDTDGA